MGGIEFTNIPKDFSSIEVTDIDGQRNLISSYLNNKKLVIVVNVASNWGLTKTNYEQLENIYKNYSSKGLEILAFPCNQFFGQEPQSEPKIKKNVTETYGVTFKLFSKVDVNGSKTHDVFKYLRINSPELATSETEAKKISWNFGKFLVDTEGKVLKYLTPSQEPNEILPLIEKILNQWK